MKSLRCSVRGVCTRMCVYAGACVFDVIVCARACACVCACVRVCVCLIDEGAFVCVWLVTVRVCVCLIADGARV